MLWASDGPDLKVITKNSFDQLEIKLQSDASALEVFGQLHEGMYEPRCRSDACTTD